MDNFFFPIVFKKTLNGPKNFSFFALRSAKCFIACEPFKCQPREFVFHQFLSGLPAFTEFKQAKILICSVKIENAPIDWKKDKFVCKIKKWLKSKTDWPKYVKLSHLEYLEVSNNILIFPYGCKGAASFSQTSFSQMHFWPNTFFMNSVPRLTKLLAKLAWKVSPSGVGLES